MPVFKPISKRSNLVPSFFFFHLKGKSPGNEIVRADWAAFSHKCRNVIGFSSLRYTIGLKKHTPLFTQSEFKPEPIASLSYTFSRASRQLHVFPVLIG